MDANSPSFVPDGFSWLAFGLAILFNILLGFVWYAKWSPTGKVWMRAQGLDPDTMQPPKGGEMAKSMVLMLVGVLLMMFVYLHTQYVYEDAFRNAASGGDPKYNLRIQDGVMGGVFTTLGFIVPLSLNAVAFERKSWGLFFVNVGYYFVALVVAGILVATL